VDTGQWTSLSHLTIVAPFSWRDKFCIPLRACFIFNQKLCLPIVFSKMAKNWILVGSVKKKVNSSFGHPILTGHQKTLYHIKIHMYFIFLKNKPKTSEEWRNFGFRRHDFLKLIYGSHLPASNDSAWCQLCFWDTLYWVCVVALMYRDSRIACTVI